jgi:hypothetical protein
MRFVETPIFTKVIDRLIDAEGYRGVQIALMLRPEQGRSFVAAGFGSCAGRDQVEGRAVASG